jgi:Flp pilus assembly protein TadG
MVSFLLHPLSKKARRRLDDESGQALILGMLAILALLAMAAFVIDVGYAYFGKRALQASVDAAALAAGQDLPDTTKATATALSYSANSGSKNEVPGVLTNVNTTVTSGCRADTPGCTSPNKLIITSTADIDTKFAKIFGINTFHVSATATACAPCGGRPADVMVVLDRTGSMCQTSTGQNDPACTDLTNAVNGIKTLLTAFNPNEQHVGLAVFPPSGEGQTCSFMWQGNCLFWSGRVDDPCNVSTGTNYGYDISTSDYLLAPLASDYQNVDRSLNANSALVSAVNCQHATGGTSYALAIEKAQAELVANGRVGADKVILFFSDGAANAGNGYFASNSPYRTQPCHQGVTSAGTAKSAGTVIYTVAYDVGGVGGGSSSCQNSTNGANESPAITGSSALSSIASGASRYYVTATAGNVNAIFNQIAAQIIHGAALTADG